ncbi:MAG: hypothetical protein DRQ89_05115 [Epsilonproteobacteria bacterium]|nr:MAG: hypothetical protein DRQ89_05115 [Campylobacterota bacterium]
MTETKYFASCPIHLEQLLINELKEFEINDIKEERGGASFTTSEKEIIRFILRSRISSRVFKQLTDFSISNEKELYEKALEYPWDEVMTPKQTLKIKCVMDRDAQQGFKSGLYLSQLLKDALTDKLREKFGERPSVDIKHPDNLFLLRISQAEDEKYNVNILLDLVGTPLSNRFYRTGHHLAPMRENLAAALVLLTDWDPEKDIFIDSMCGSGTILIEAAMIKEKIAPTYFRLLSTKFHFAFQKQIWFTKNGSLQDFYLSEINKIKKLAKKGLDNLHNHQFFGFDIDQENIDTARNNLKNAKLDNVIKLKRLDSTRLMPPADPPGVIICNTPYGERIGEKKFLEQVMYNYGENLKKNFSGFRAYLLTVQELRKRISLSTSSRVSLKNGNIDCTLVRYDLY